jgi:hypothetical protein
MQNSNSDWHVYRALNLWQGLLRPMTMILTPSLCSELSQHNTMTVSLLLWKISSFLQLVKDN